MPNAGVVEGVPKAGVEGGGPNAGVEDGVPKAGVVEGVPKAGVEPNIVCFVFDDVSEERGVLVLFKQELPLAFVLL